jgi:hypothetical protein
MMLGKPTQKIWHGPVFFIVGCSRSGTTWARNIYNAHPAVLVGEESYFFCDVTPSIRRAYAAKDGEPTGLHRYVTTEGLARGIELFFRRLVWERARKKSEAIWFGEKTPAHVHRIAEILEVLPDARFVHVVRDVRDVVASMLDAARSWSPNPEATAVTTADTWRRAVTAGLQAEERWPDRFLRVRYEDLAEDGVATIRRLFDFLEIYLDNQQAGEIRDATRFERYTGGRRPGDPGGQGQFYRKGIVGGWRNSLSEADQRIALSAAGGLHRSLGYAD